MTATQNIYVICLIQRSDQKSAANAWRNVPVVMLTGQPVNITCPAVNITYPLTRPVNTDYLSTSCDARWTNHDRVRQTVIYQYRLIGRQPGLEELFVLGDVITVAFVHYLCVMFMCKTGQKHALSKSVRLQMVPKLQKCHSSAGWRVVTDTVRKAASLIST